MGSSCSRCCTSVVIPEAPLFNPLTTSHAVTVNSRVMRAIENCLVLWLLDELPPAFDADKRRLSRLVYGLQVFTNSEQCLAYIREINDEKLFLIISVTQQSVEYLYHFSSLERIYIYEPCSTETSRDGQKDIYRDMESLAKQLQYDIELCELDLLPFSAAPLLAQDLNPELEMNHDEASFLCIHLIAEIMARLKFESRAKEEFINFCRSHYVNHEHQLSLIEEFTENYRPHQAIEWLTRRCFLSRILDRANRTREIDILYKLGFFIKHVKMQLIRLREEHLSELNRISVVYRGRTMIPEEFDLSIRYNIHGLLSFASFLRASTQKDTALQFIRQRRRGHPRSDTTAIIFEIHVDPTMYNEEYPFALLRNRETKENEIALCIATAFRIEAAEHVNEGSTVYWIVKLKLIGIHDEQLAHHLRPFRTIELHENPLSCIGRLLMNMGENRRAEQCFLKMLDDSSILSQPRRLVRAQNGLAVNYTCKGEHGKALEHYKQALQISLTYLPSNHSELSNIYKAIGDTYVNQNDYWYALENYKRAIYLLEINKPPSSSQTLADLKNLAQKTRRWVDTHQ